ncbi:hypothetical protein QLX08_009357 [Tetragonisca angustula]|uniref:Uncharacterized protein n=1 Tax=Tetragonisca angustula TaxID=166442 RepID=A0AAW0ZHD1_9HYME
MGEGVITRAKQRKKQALRGINKVEEREIYKGEDLDAFIEKRMEEFKKELLETLCEQMNKEMMELGWKPPATNMQQRIMEKRAEINSEIRRDDKERNANNEGNYIHPSSTEWSKVVRRKGSRKNGEHLPWQTEENYTRNIEGRERNRIPRPPRRSAVILTVAPGSNKNYAEIMKEARVVKLQEMDIEGLRCRKSITGAMIIEVPGKDNREKANKLVERPRKIFGNTDEVRINRPEKMAEMRIKDLDDSVIKQEVANAIARYGECKEEQVTVGEIRRVMPRLMGIAWVRCPLSAARKIAQDCGRVVNI